MKLKSDHLLIGLSSGIVAPPIAFIVFCFFSFPDDAVMDILASYIRRNVLTHVISLAVLINLPMFFAFLKVNKFQTARGVIGATLIYAFLILILKLT